MTIKTQKNIFTNKFHDSSKLQIISDIHSLVTQYYKLVSILSNVFLNSDEKQNTLKEIEILEKVIQSKIKISSLMRGF